ncbi:hypothetical protein H5410_051222 [Solanum commersonii]|uniref:Uncharacterized protein n=1 Tax=Solanum commersonii TaxID=4109 RepID=A0A9J5WXS2_SOLCO|nr:hypothetical protein H5410_051222 [Solanum commersonii]
MGCLANDENDVAPIELRNLRLGSKSGTLDCLASWVDLAEWFGGIVWLVKAQCAKPKMAPLPRAPRRLVVGTTTHGEAREGEAVATIKVDPPHKPLDGSGNFGQVFQAISQGPRLPPRPVKSLMAREGWRVGEQSTAPQLMDLGCEEAFDLGPSRATTTAALTDRQGYHRPFAVCGS